MATGQVIGNQKKDGFMLQKDRICEKVFILLVACTKKNTENGTILFRSVWTEKTQFV